MDHTESSLMKLNKEDLVRLLLDYQCKFSSLLGDLRIDFEKLEAEFTK